MPNIGELYTLRHPSPPSEAAFFTWSLWDGTATVSEGPELQVMLNQTGTLNYTVYAVDQDGSNWSHSGSVMVPLHPTVSSINITSNGLEYGYETTVSVTGSVDGVWLDQNKNPLSGVPSGPELTLKVYEDVTLVYRQVLHGTIDTYIHLWGKPVEPLVVSPIVASPGRGRLIAGKYVDFLVLTKPEYAVSWNLGGFSLVTTTDAVVDYGHYRRYKARVSIESRGLNETMVTFTASHAGKSRTVLYQFKTFENSAPNTGVFTIREGENVAPPLVDFWVDEGKTVHLEADPVDDRAWEDNSTIGDLVQYSWEFFSEKDNEWLPTKYGRTATLDTTGFGGSGLTGVLKYTDPYGTISSKVVNRIAVRRSVPIEIKKVDLQPTSPLTSGVPVVVEAELENQAWNIFSRFSGLQLAWDSDLPESNEYSRTHSGAVLDTSGFGGSAIAGAVTATDDVGETVAKSFSIAVGNRSPSSVVIWNNAHGNKVEAGRPITFYACSLDPDADPNLVFEWSFTNPVSFQVGSTAVINTSNSLVGSKVLGKLTVYDPAQNRARSTDNGTNGTTFVVKDVLVLAPFNDTGIGETPVDGPDCPPCSEIVVSSPTPTLVVSGQSSVQTGIPRNNAFLIFYSGYDIIRIRKVLTSSLNQYNCDTGWIAAPNPRQHTENLNWDSQFKIDSTCISPFDTGIGTFTLTLYVELTDGRIFSDSHAFSVNAATFTNEHQGTLTVSCASGYCGENSVSVEVIAGFDASTTNQSFAQLGLPDTASSQLAQQTVNDRAISLATALLESRSRQAPWCYPVGVDCVCAAIGSALDAQVVSKWSGDARTAAQTASSQIASGDWTTYEVTINNVAYKFTKQQVGSNSAMLCLVSALNVTPNTYITLVFDSSGSMNGTLAPLQRITAAPDGKLYRALTNIYEGDYDAKVKVESDSSELWVQQLLSHVKPDTTTPSREQIVMIFSDEDSSYTSNTTAADHASALRAAVTDPAKFDYYVGALFAVNPTTVSTSSPYVADRWDWLMSNSPDFAAMASAPAGSIAQLKIVRNVEDFGDGLVTDDYYFGVIQQMLSEAGINLVDPDA